MEPENPELVKESLKQNISEEEKSKIAIGNAPSMKPLSKSAMKKFFRFLIIANKRMRKNNHPLTVHKPSIDEMRSKVENIKKTLDEKSAPKELPIIEKTKDTISRSDRKKEDISKISRKAKVSKKARSRKKIDTKKQKETILSKELLARIDKFGKKNISKLKDAKINKDDKGNGEKKEQNNKVHPDPEFDKRSRAILDIKSIIFDLEKKHKHIVQKNEHHPLLLRRIEEKINFLKKRISDIEDGRQDYQSQA